MSLNEGGTQMRKREVHKACFMALLLAVFMAGCGGGGAGGPVTPVIPVPTLGSVSPNNGIQGQNVAVTLTGTNFVSGATVVLNGTGITVSNTALVSSTQLTATFTIAASAPTGAQNVTVTTSDGTSNAQSSL